MRKLGVFVEGQTEQLFVHKLVKTLAGAKGLKIIVEKKISKSYVVIETESGAQDEMLILIVDCSNDEQVKSAILERREGLISQGFSSVIGLRDLYPLKKNELSLLKAGLLKRVPTKDLSIVFTVANGEVEAWFIQEGFHYNKIDANLNREIVSAKMSFDTEKDSSEGIEHPASFLDETYKIVNKRYTKRKANALRTIDAIDYENLYVEAIKRIPSFQEFIEHLEAFLFPPAQNTECVQVSL